MVVCSLEAPAPAAPPASRSQISNVWVVALPKFFTASQSTTSHVSLPSVSVAIRIDPDPPVAGLRLKSVHHGAITLFGRAGSGKCCGANLMSALAPPPSTRYPFETTPTLE